MEKMYLSKFTASLTRVRGYSTWSRVELNFEAVYMII